MKKRLNVQTGWWELVDANGKVINDKLKKATPEQLSAKQTRLKSNQPAAAAAQPPAGNNTGVVNRINNLNNDIYSIAEDTGERLPFNKDVAGKGDGSVSIDIKPWYGDQMKTNYTPEQWNEFVKNTGFKPTTKNTSKDPKAQVKEFQYYLAHNPDWKGSIDELHSASDKGFGKPTKSKKKYDGYLGRRWDLLIEKKPEEKPEEKPVVPSAPEDDKKIAKTDDKVVKDEERKPFETNTPTNYNLPENGPWWLQDIIKTAGAAGDLGRIKKYLPYQATPQVRLPDATFYDPTRELAANAEQANMAYQAQTAFTNPQQLAAASSVTQGQAAKNAADVMGRYNNLNVGLANQLPQERTNIMNTASQNKANLDTQLWDKYTIANQQFDNSKAKARENLRSSYIDAITNRANTANLNSLYPEYAVDPSRGGFIHFNPNAAKIKPTDKYSYMDTLWSKAKTMDPADPKGMMKILLSKGAGDGTDEDEYYNNLKKVNSRAYNNSKKSEETEE